DGEQLQSDLAETINWHVVDQLLVLNFGEDARGSVYFEPNPIQDESRTLAREVIKGMTATPDGREFLRVYLDFEQISEMTTLPTLPDAPDQSDNKLVDADNPAKSIMDELESTVTKG
ncbi:MAG TPA: hypothetical protein DER01_07825, partial [Phycisphaerales bacterium]|nr:hypothetical protein [Phycisphaerales bacterium]